MPFFSINCAYRVTLIALGDGSHHITIAEAKTSMNGSLVCRATNSFGSTESRATVIVKEVDREPKISKKLQDHDAVEGEAVKFSAVISGRPTPTIAWFLNEEELKISEEIKIKYDESTGKASMKILKPVENQTGKVCFFLLHGYIFNIQRNTN